LGLLILFLCIVTRKTREGNVQLTNAVVNNIDWNYTVYNDSIKEKIFQASLKKSSLFKNFPKEHLYHRVCRQTYQQIHGHYPATYRQQIEREFYEEMTTQKLKNLRGLIWQEIVKWQNETGKKYGGRARKNLRREILNYIIRRFTNRPLNYCDLNDTWWKEDDKIENRCPTNTHRQIKC
jgi:hypothetical protein